MPSPEPAQLPASNFAFLRAEWGEFYRRAREVERRVFFDPRAACVEGRITLEEIVRWLYEYNPDLQDPYRSDLSARLAEPTFTALVGRPIAEKTQVIRGHGNRAAHDGRVQVNERASLAVARELFHVLIWVATAYSKDRSGLDGLAFDVGLIPRPRTAEERAKAVQLSRDKLRQLQEAQDRRERELKDERERASTLESELEKARAELAAYAAIKARNDAEPVRHDWDEATTRDEKIDLLLAEAGWDVDAPSATEYEVDGMPRREGGGVGKGYVDYVLWGDDGLPLALVEAKAARHSPEKGRQQAKLYADRLEARFGRRPIIYYTNGYNHTMWDDVASAPRPVAGFRTKAELTTLIGRRTASTPLGDVPTNSAIAERAYQEKAIRAVCGALEQHQRGVLLVMATGTGKTRTVIALTDVLMRAGLVKRTLFLADRQALVTQATKEFRRHLPSSTTINLLDVADREQEGRVYVSTYQTMMGLIGEGRAGEEKRFGPGAFDLVIVDEAHRSVYKKYGAIFTYFDALLVGLTATPRDEIHRDTYRVFNLEAGVPTEQYGLTEAVDEHYLVPPIGVDVPVKFVREGVRYAELSEDERDQWEEAEWGSDGSIPNEVAASDINAKLFNKDTVDKVLQVVMERGATVDGGDRLGKTIVFAKNQRHAEFIVQRFDLNYPHLAGRFARVITHGVEHAHDLIEEFSTPDSAMRIAVSVDMLDTGIDIPEVLNLVFFKVVRSSTKFWQMVGRGTRLCPNLLGPGRDKECFYVFDVCRNLDFFDLDLPPLESAPARPLRQRIFDARVDLVELLDETGGGDGPVREVRDAVASELRGEVLAMPPENFIVRPHLELVERFAAEAAWRRIAADDALDLKERLSALPTAVTDRDEGAKRFDLLMLHLQRGTLAPDSRDAKRREQVQEIAAALLQQTSIPAIAKQADVLTDLTVDLWWDDVTIPLLEHARRRVRDLVRLVPPGQRMVVYTDFVDDLGEVVERAMPKLPGASDFVRFQEKVRLFLREYENELVLIKLRRNEPLTEQDLERLRDLMLEFGVGTRADVQRAADAAHGLGLFIRSLVGLDEIAARDAVDEFIQGRALSVDQLRFLDEIVKGLIRNGVVDPGALFDSPYSELAGTGPDELFAEAELIDLFAVLKRVKRNAVPGERDQAA
jgi:type I restriction enzyme R subunit